MPERQITRVNFIPKPKNIGNGTHGRKRVVAYARVSTESDEQEHSLKVQTEYFENYVKENPAWEYIGIYVDDGISGLSYENRDGFNRMIADAVSGGIDLIITKSLSRFARNTVDSLTIIRKLKAAGVGVYFQKEDINTLDAKGEFLITLMSSFAEEESRSISENITWGKRKQFADGQYTAPFARFLGYTRGNEPGEFVIDEDEARVVRFIYMLALEGVPIFHIATILTENAIPTLAGKANWQSCVVRSILQNEKYKGDALLQKRYTVDFRTKKQKANEGELPQYYVTGGHPAVISRKAWDETQPKLQVDGKKQNSINDWSQKLRCGCCGSFYGMKLWHSTTYHNFVLECNGRKKKGSACKNTHIYETEFKKAVLLALREFYKCNPGIQSLCASIARSVPLNGKEKVLKRIKTITADDVRFDNSAMNILITGAVVTPDAEIEFRFIDGSSYRYEISGKTPRGQKNMNTRKEQHKEILVLSSQGKTPSEIGKILGVSPNTVRSYLRRLK